MNGLVLSPYYVVTPDFNVDPISKLIRVAKETVASTAEKVYKASFIFSFAQIFQAPVE